MIIIMVISLLPLVSPLYHDNLKTLKTLPAFTDSLVNLGKMDISFYFMTKPEDLKQIQNADHSSGLFSPKIETIVEEACPCTSKYTRNFPKNNPTELLRKILTGNELFSFSKNSETSVLCCESHENVQENTIFLEFSPKQIPVRDNPMQQNLPFLPFLFDNIGQNKQTVPLKPKALEIFFFPKKKGIIDIEKAKREAIQIVGDKELRNDFKTMKLTPPQAQQSSVKKDLALKVKDKAVTTTAEAVKLYTTPANPNML